MCSRRFSFSALLPRLPLCHCLQSVSAGLNFNPPPSGPLPQVHALSPDGRCKAFGAEADGYGRGEGFTATVLEPLGPASAPHALALVAGSAVNQDGRSSGLTAPQGPSQQALIMAAMREAGTAVLGYVASHGTGTPLGDPIETGALRKAVVQGSSAGASFTAGAIKTLTGHMEGTAGLAGLLLCQVQLSFRFAHALRYRCGRTRGGRLIMSVLAGLLLASVDPSAWTPSASPSHPNPAC